MSGFFSKALLGVALSLLAGVSGAVAYTTDTSVQPAPNYNTFQPPARSGSYNDPVFGSTITRVTNALSTANADGGGNLTFITPEYSTMTPFNADNSRFLLVHQSYNALYDALGNYLRDLPFEVNSSSEPRWSRSDPNVLYYVRGNALKSYNISTGAIATVHAFTEYTAISGKGESDICFDGNHFVLAGDNRYVFVYDIAANVKSPVLDTGGRAFDSLYIGYNDFVAISWLQSGTSRYNGVELFDKNMNFQRQLTHAGGHMDMGADVNGDPVLVWTNSNDPQPLCGQNAIVKVRLADGQQTCVLSLDWSLAVHISAADNTWAFVETYAPSDPDPSSSGWKAYTNELLQIKLDGTEVRRLLHHRSRPVNSYNYMPKVSTSRDASRIVWTSNYDLQRILVYPTEYADTYMMLTGAATQTSGGTTGGTTDTTGGTTGTTGGTTGGTTTTTTTSTTTRYQENDASVTYSGTWSVNNSAANSGSRAVLSTDKNSSATITFTGNAVKWIAYRDEWSGIAKVVLDGNTIGTFDMYASPALAQAVAYSVTALTQGKHTLQIAVTGRRSRKSSGSWVWVDAFDVTSTTGTTTTTTTSGTTSGSTTTTTTGTTTRIQQDAPGVVYTGTWYPNTNAAMSGGTAVLAMDAGSRTTVTFTGTGVKWIAYRDEWSGIAQVSLPADGIIAKRVLYLV